MIFPEWIIEDFEKYKDLLGEDGLALYTAQEFGELFRVDRRTVYTWIGSGHLRGFYTPGRRLRIPRTEYLRLTRFPNGWPETNS